MWCIFKKFLLYCLITKNLIYFGIWTVKDQSGYNLPNTVYKVYIWNCSKDLSVQLENDCYLMMIRVHGYEQEALYSNNQT